MRMSNRVLRSFKTMQDILQAANKKPEKNQLNLYLEKTLVEKIRQIAEKHNVTPCELCSLIFEFTLNKI